MSKAAGWFVYMVRCADRTLYTGITTDLARRLAEHNGPRAARYTRVRQPVRLVYHETAPDRACAARRECQIKRLQRRAKEALIAAARSSMTTAD